MSTQTITIAPEVLDSKTFRPLVERATEWLVPLLSPDDEAVTGEWTRVDNRPGVEMVALTLRDPSSSPVRFFRAHDLEDRSQTEHTFNAMLRSLLRTRTHFLLKQLLETSAVSGE